MHTWPSGLCPITQYSDHQLHRWRCLTGEVTDVTDTTIRRNTSDGAVTIPLAGVTCIGAACPEAVRQNIEDLPKVVLSTPDGSVKLAGSLLEIADDQYVLATEAGEMRLNISDVNCEGDACQDAQADFAFGGPVVLESDAAVVEGILTGLDEDSYFVEVDVLGSLRVSRDFACSGTGCPPN